MIEELSSIGGKLCATLCENRGGWGGQGPIPSVMFSRAHGFGMREREEAFQKCNGETAEKLRRNGLGLKH